MGGTTSKQDPATEPIMVNNQVNENSEGFHVLELHLPTVGTSLLSTLVLLSLVFCVYKGFKKCNQFVSAPYHQANQRNMVMQQPQSGPLPPWQHYWPPPTISPPFIAARQEERADRDDRPHQSHSTTRFEEVP